MRTEVNASLANQIDRAERAEAARDAQATLATEHANTTDHERLQRKAVEAERDALKADLAKLKAASDTDADTIATWRAQAKAKTETIHELRDDLARLRSANIALEAALEVERQDCVNCKDSERDLHAAFVALVARVNARAEAEMLAGRPITGAHHRALTAELAALTRETEANRG